MLTELGANRGLSKHAFCCKPSHRPGLEGEAAAPPGQAPLTAQPLRLVCCLPPQEGPVSLGALVGLQLADVTLLVRICLVNIPLEGAQRF